MFHVFVLIAILGTGSPEILTSKQTWDTKEACEQEAPLLVAKLKGEIAQQAQVVTAKCDTDENMQKALEGRPVGEKVD